MDIKVFNINVIGDERGKLVSLESNKNIPFELKRIYYIYDTESNFIRGKHSHKNLEQIVIAIDGSCQFYLDNGKTSTKVWLNRPDQGLYIGRNIWREMRNFSYGCKLLVLASNYYDENDYIRNYSEFIESISKK